MTGPVGPHHPNDNDDDDNDDELRSTSVNSPADQSARPDQPLHDPLPYGLGFSAPETYDYGGAGHGGAGHGVAGFGMTPAPAAPAAGVDVVEDRRSGSPVLAVAGLLSLGVAVWAILGAPVLSTTMVITAALVLLVLVGLTMVIRR